MQLLFLASDPRFHGIALVLTELETALQIGRRRFLIINSEDDLLLRLLKELKFQFPAARFDLSVDYDKELLAKLHRSYAERQNSKRRAESDQNQVRDFLATLPLYLDHFTERAITFPTMPNDWSGHLKLWAFEEVRDLIDSLNASITADGVVGGPGNDAGS